MKFLRYLLISTGLMLGGLAQAQDVRNLPVTNCSGTITVGGTSQTLLPFSSTRRGFALMNLSTDKLGFSFVGAAAIDAIGTFHLTPATVGPTGNAGGSYVSTSAVNNAVTIVGATTGDKFTCMAW